MDESVAMDPLAQHPWLSLWVCAIFGRQVGPPLQSVSMDQGSSHDEDKDMAHALRAAR